MSDTIYYTPRQVAEKLNLSTYYVQELARTGKLGSIKLGRLIRIPSTDLDAYIEKHRQRPAFLIHRKEAQHEQ